MSKTQTEDYLSKRFKPLQSLLCCPVSRGELSLLSLPELISRLPEHERARVPAETTAAFVSESVALAYPVIGQIISFLEQDALHLRNAETTARMPADPEAADVKESVKGWYDSFGWKKNEQGLYNDTALFSQCKPAGHGLYELESHLSLLSRLAGGAFVLDAASGAIAHPEKLAYSWFYRYRVSVDLSLAALKEADAKVGEKGYCCLADICRLPFRDDSFDGIVSAYTIQHIPDSQQAQAVKELYRVLHPSAHLCIITDVAHTRWHEGIVFFCRAIKKILKTLGLVGRSAPEAQAHETVTGSEPPHSLYFVTHDWKWWQRVGNKVTNRSSLECLRLFTKPEYELLFGQSTKPAKVIRVLQTCFPRLLARGSAFCLLDLYKP